MRLGAHARATAFGMISPNTSMTGGRIRVTTTGARPPSVGRRLHAAPDASASGATERVAPPPAGGFVRFAREGGPSGRVESVDGELAGDGEGGGAHARDEPLGLVDLGGDPADQPPQKVRGRDGPRGPAVLVHDD